MAADGLVAEDPSEHFYVPTIGMTKPELTAAIRLQGLRSVSAVLETLAADQEQYAFIDWVMLHEFGHTLGLPDFYADTSTLQGQIAIMNEHWVAQDIKDEDLEQLKAIYILHTSH